MPVIAYGSPLLLKRAFAAGAYDYLKEPWTADELWTRVTRMIEGRQKSYRWGSTVLEGTHLRRREDALGITEVELSLQEAAILKTLLRNRGRAVSRETLFYVLWGRQPRRRSRVVDVHVAALRSKLRRLAPRNGERGGIATVRGVGYMMR